MAVSCVQCQHIDACLDQCSRALHIVRPDADSCSHEETSARVGGCARIVALLLDVLDGDQPLEVKVVIDQRQFFDTMLLQDLLCLVQGGADRRRNQAFGGHQLGYRTGVIGGEANIAVGKDTYEARTLSDGHTRDVIVRNEALGVAEGGCRWQGDRVHDHPRFTPLDLVHFGDLLLDRAIAVDDAQSALARQSDGESSLCHRIHGCGQDGDGEAYLRCQYRGHVDGVR